MSVVEASGSLLVAVPVIFVKLQMRSLILGVIIKTFGGLLDAKMVTKIGPGRATNKNWFPATISVDFLIIFVKKCTRLRTHFLSS